jgi:hypothetical protein
MLGDSLRRWRMPRAARRTEKGALVAVALEFLHSRKYAIVHRVHNVLLTAEISFRGLDRGVPQQKLYLFEIPYGQKSQTL